MPKRAASHVVTRRRSSSTVHGFTAVSLRTAAAHSSLISNGSFGGHITALRTGNNLATWACLDRARAMSSFITVHQTPTHLEPFAPHTINLSTTVLYHSNLQVCRLVVLPRTAVHMWTPFSGTCCLPNCPSHTPPPRLNNPKKHPTCEEGLFCPCRRHETQDS